VRIVVTGGDGFIGRNLRLRLDEAGHLDVMSVTRATDGAEFRRALENADFVFHLAGVNRPTAVAEFEEGNAGTTRWLASVLRDSGRAVPVVFASSTQAALDNPYGRSKRAAEEALSDYGRATGGSVYLLRLTNVFGKWARPNYNSAVATFCYNVARGLPITVNDSSTSLNLLYIDDAVTAMLGLIDGETPSGFVDVRPTYATTVGEVANLIQSFRAGRQTLVSERVGTGLPRVLHATYLSYLPPDDFGYTLTRHADPRGVFVEMLKTKDSGQFSYFTAGPGVTRGGHYHHTKAEKFLVITGKALFRFKHVSTGERFEITVDATEARVVETVPGWAHDVTNIGSGEMVVMLWANEVFDPQHPDTIAHTVLS
jgi:UDP-2-acetamido-2,6-beta-L-arabino-hexul-4-ose reductase